MTEAEISQQASLEISRASLGVAILGYTAKVAQLAFDRFGQVVDRIEKLEEAL